MLNLTMRKTWLRVGNKKSHPVFGMAFYYYKMIKFISYPLFVWTHRAPFGHLLHEAQTARH